MGDSWLVALWVGMVMITAAFQVLKYLILIHEAKKRGSVPNGIAQANLLRKIRNQLPEGRALNKVRFFESGSWVTVACLICLFAILAYTKH